MHKLMVSPYLRKCVIYIIYKLLYISSDSEINYALTFDLFRRKYRQQSFKFVGVD